MRHEISGEKHSGGIQNETDMLLYLYIYINIYIYLYNNKINVRVLIGQSAMVYCAGKPMEKSRAF